MMTNSNLSMLAVVNAPSMFVSNMRSLRALLSVDGLRSLTPVERLDEAQLDRLMQALESGRYRISPANWNRLRDQRYQMQLQEYGNRQLRNARTSDENRYEDDQQPESPNVMWGLASIRGHVIGLEDGRLARRIDHTRAIPFCGLQVPVSLSDCERAQDGVSRVRWVTGPVQCRRCDGYHLPMHTEESSSRSSRTDSGESVVDSLNSEIRCPHCQGISVNFQREGMVLIAHCLCGWEGVTSLLGLDETLVAQNTQSLLAAPVRDVEDEEELLMPMTNWDGMAETNGQVGEEDGDELDESEAGDLVEALVGMTEGTDDTAVDSDSSDTATDTSDDQDLLDEVLTRAMVNFWASPAHLGVRRMLLDRTMCAELGQSHSSDDETDQAGNRVAMSCGRLGLIWTVAAILTQDVARFTLAQQEELVSWLIASSDEELRQFLPEGADEIPLPNVYAKIRSWMRSCRARVMKFRSESAGVRLLSRQFGVSETAFRTALMMTAGR